MQTRETRPRRLAPLALAASLLLAACGERGAAPDGRPDLLFVVFDTTRADHIGCYGAPGDPSPTVDALAAQGLLCAEAWSHSSLTPVSAGSFLTGALPYRHGVRSLLTVGEGSLAPGVTTLAERLGRAGWDTGAFVSAPPMGSRYGFDRGFDVFDDEMGPGVKRRLAQGLGNAWQRRADETTDAALAWLEERGARPFAMLLHYFDAHDATLVPPRAFLERHVDFPLPPDLDQRGHLNEVKDPAQRIALYDAEIRYMDAQLARVLAALEQAGRREDTLIVFLADHGEGLGQHDFWTHGLLWNEQLRVPLVLAGPGLPRGERLEARVRLVDLVPTLSELLGLPVDPAQLDGSSFLPLLEGGEDAPRPVYAEVRHAPEDRFGRDAEMAGLVLGRWKYVHRPVTGAHQLFDLEADPGELVDLYTPEHEMARTLAGMLEATNALGGPLPSIEDLAPEDRAMLEKLGYL